MGKGRAAVSLAVRKGEGRIKSGENVNIIFHREAIDWMAQRMDERGYNVDFMSDKHLEALEMEARVFVDASGEPSHPKRMRR